MPSSGSSRDTILPKIQIFRRNVAGQSYRLFRADPAGPDVVYVCLVFTKLVGSTPESAGEGPTVLCKSPLPVDAIASDLSALATITVLNEL